MVEIDFDAELREIERKLGGLKDKAPKVLVASLNSAARRVRKQIVENAKGEYEFKEKALTNVGKALRMQRAREGNLMVKLNSSGQANDLMKFMVSPAEVLRGKDAPDSYAAKVLKGTGLTSLSLNPKPFVTKFESGHIAIVQRIPGQYMKSNGKYRLKNGRNQKKEFLKKLLSPSVPHMLRNPEVQAQAQVLLGENLHREINYRINKILEEG